MLEATLGGKPISEKDPQGLLNFYADLSRVHCLAEETGRAQDFDAKSTIDAVLKKKLPHLTAKWFKKFVKYRKSNNADLGFSDFLDFVDEEHSLAEMYFRAMGSFGATGGGAKPPVVGAKIAATSAMGGGKSSAGSAAPTPGKCPLCNAAHTLAECHPFRDADAETKRRACSATRACFKCLEPGHIARDCRTETRCTTCQRPHHSWAHAIQPARDGGAANDAGGGAA